LLTELDGIGIDAKVCGQLIPALEMRPKPKRASLIRMIGKEILKTLPTYDFDNRKGSDVSVTAARRFIRENKLGYNIVINVKRTSHTTDRFYWCKKGLFSADFAECNYINFMELRSISKSVVNRETVFKMMDANLEMEQFAYEYRYG